MTLRRECIGWSLCSLMNVLMNVQGDKFNVRCQNPFISFHNMMIIVFLFINLEYLPALKRGVSW